MSGGGLGTKVQNSVGSQGMSQLGSMAQSPAQAQPGVLNPGQFTRYNDNALSSQPGQMNSVQDVYEQWVQQRQAPKPMLPVMPQKPGVGPMPIPQVLPVRPPIGAPNPSMTNVLPVRPPAQVNPGKPQMPSGLAGLANAIRGRR